MMTSESLSLRDQRAILAPCHHPGGMLSASCDSPDSDESGLTGEEETRKDHTQHWIRCRASALSDFCPGPSS